MNNLFIKIDSLYSSYLCGGFSDFMGLFIVVINFIKDFLTTIINFLPLDNLLCLFNIIDVLIDFDSLINILNEDP